MVAIMDFEVDVKNVTEGRREGEGRGGDQARFFMWITIVCRVILPLSIYNWQRGFKECFGTPVFIISLQYNQQN